MKGFLNFIKEQGVIGLAVGFILGGAVSKVVSSLVTDIINPILGVVLGVAGNLNNSVLKLGKIEIMWGNFVSVVIDFLIIAMVVYYGVKILGLNKIDKKK